MYSAQSAKEALVALLAVRDGLSGVLVDRGLPGKVPPQRDRIYVAGAKGVKRTPSGGVGGPRMETFAIQIVVETLNKGLATAATSEARMWTLVDEIDAQTAEDPELGVAVVDCWLEVDDELTAPTTDGWLSRAVCRLYCETYVKRGANDAR